MMNFKPVTPVDLFTSSDASPIQSLEAHLEIRSELRAAGIPVESAVLFKKGAHGSSLLVTIVPSKYREQPLKFFSDQGEVHFVHVDASRTGWTMHIKTPEVAVKGSPERLGAFKGVNNIHSIKEGERYMLNSTGALFTWGSTN